MDQVGVDTWMDKVIEKRKGNLEEICQMGFIRWMLSKERKFGTKQIKKLCRAHAMPSQSGSGKGLFPSQSGSGKEFFPSQSGSGKGLFPSQSGSGKNGLMNARAAWAPTNTARSLSSSCALH